MYILLGFRKKGDGVRTRGLPSGVLLEPHIEMKPTRSTTKNSKITVGAQLDNTSNERSTSYKEREYKTMYIYIK